MLLILADQYAELHKLKRM
jgi:DNA-directed RNA polymerase specialized sigma24 family protein